jgi:hypothetical protein
VEKRYISCPYGELKPNCLASQLTAHRNTDWAILTPTPLGRSKNIRRHWNWRRYKISWPALMIFYLAKIYTELHRESEKKQNESIPYISSLSCYVCPSTILLHISLRSSSYCSYKCHSLVGF